MAVNKFFHSIMSGWVVGALFVAGISCWFLWRKRDEAFALSSIRVAVWVGLAASLLVAWTGDGSGYQVAQKQPMKLAAMEGFYEGSTHAGLVAFAVLNPEKKQADDGLEPFLFRMEIPDMLSLLAERKADAFVPGINDLLKGGYVQKDGTEALSAEQKMECGRKAIAAFADYRKAVARGDEAEAERARAVLQENMPYFGYGYIKDANELVPNVPLTFYMFRVMVMLGGYFILFFCVLLFLSYKKDLSRMRWMQLVTMLSVPLGYLAGQAGWVVAECGRQPWSIQDMLPTGVAVSRLDVGSVQTTFFIFLLLFTIMLAAEVRIMIKAVGQGPEK